MRAHVFSKSTFFAATLSIFLLSGCNQSEVNTDKVVSPKNVNPQSGDKESEPEVQSQGDAIVSKVPDALKAQYLDLINAARSETRDCGSEGVFDPAPVLVWNDRLGNAAWEHSNDMAKSNTFSHIGSGTQTDVTAQELELGHGSHFRDRIDHIGYTDYSIIGENIAAGYFSAQKAIDAWLQSDHHCANLMNPQFSEVGMALVREKGTKFRSYWSQELGSR